MGNGKDRLKDREFVSPLFQSKFQFLFVVVKGSKYGQNMGSCNVHNPICGISV
jgi:hypothetical protein